MRDRNHLGTIICIRIYALFVVRHVYAAPSPRLEHRFSATLLGGCRRYSPECREEFFSETRLPRITNTGSPVL